MAPYKCAVLPLSSHTAFQPMVKQICTLLSVYISFHSFFVVNIDLGDLLTEAGISFKADTSNNAIGRRYARCDEICIPFAITIDFDALQEPNTVVLRELDSLQQVRVKVRI